MKIIYAYFLVFSYIFLIIGISNIIKKKTKNEELSRKIVHIFVSFSWITMYLYFKDTIHLLIPPFIFIILNYISYKKNIFRGIERKNNNTYGTVFYAISMFLCSILSLIDNMFLIPYGIGLFIMAWGDGVASLVGINSKSMKLIKNKTLFGSLSFIICSITVLVIFNSIFKLEYNVFVILYISLFAALSELISKRGYDNLIVPIIVCLLSYLMRFI